MSPVRDDKAAAAARRLLGRAAGGLAMRPATLKMLQRRGRQATLAGTFLWLLSALWQHGYGLLLFPHQDWWHAGVDAFVVAAFAFGIGVAFLQLRVPGASRRPLLVDLLFLLFAVFASLTLHAGTVVVILRRARRGLVLLASTRGAQRYVAMLQRRPAVVLVLSFAATIAVGTVLLTFAAATEDGRGAPLLTALFTATSATCVTGLIVVDTPAYFSLFGELVILGLIQIGGLGIMTLSAALFILMGRRLTARQRRVLASVLDEARLRDVGAIVLDIVQATLILEGLGALLLFVRWSERFDSLTQAAYMSVFHSVSAFCNAGFSLLSDSLVGFVADPFTNTVVAVLIVLGGLGFSVLSDLYAHRSPRRAAAVLSTHTRVVLVASALLILFGGLALFYFEFEASLGPLPVLVKLQAAFFQSVAARTAGFNTVDMTQITAVAALVFVVLMFVGGSPGGTAGGIKTSTLAILLLSVRTILKGRDEIEIFGRSVPKENVYRALAVTMISWGIVSVLFVGLLATQGIAFVPLLFECVSAFGTVGLSMGATPQLTALGQGLIILAMFVGRIGPLTVAFLVGEEMERHAYRYPATKLLVG